jgi:NADH-quinone oxidoreductase subunit N
MTDFAAPGALLSALLPEITLLIGTLILLLVGAWGGESSSPTRRSARFAIGIVGVTAVAVVFAWMRGDGFTTDGRLTGDGFRWAIDLVLLLGTAGALAIFDTEQLRTRAYQAEIPVLMLLALSGMMIMTASRDLMFTYIGLELMSIAVYVLAGANRSSARSAEASIKYFLLGAFASGFLLYGIALLYGAVGDTRLSALGAASASTMYLVGVALLLVGFAFKVGAVPFHLWTPDVYDGAPSPITAFMAACVKASAFAMIVRVVAEGLGPAMAHWHPAVWWLAAITMVVGNVVALAQPNIKRMLAYSSIAHSGYLLVAVLAYSQEAAAAVVFYLLAYTLATLGAFAVLGIVSEGRETAITIDDLSGLWHVRPGLAVTLAVCLLAFFGFPIAGGAGFFAKWYVIQAALTSHTPLTVLVVVLVLASVVSAGYYLTAISSMFNRPRPSQLPMPVQTPLLSGIVMVAAVVSLLVLGVYPTPASRLAAAATLQAAPSMAPVAGTMTVSAPAAAATADAGSTP